MGVQGIRLIFNPGKNTFEPEVKSSTPRKSGRSRKTVKEWESERSLRRFIPPIPAPWFQKAASLPGKALAVGLILRYEVAIGRKDSVRLTRQATAAWGVGRDARRRALQVLETAGLIDVQKRLRSTPVVTIVEMS